ncbi:cytochrome c oxidase subunit 3 [uncultured Maricaulis sp.]|uniref:cytochrome c oxidase subunit 3 n=1 Tax=uncultured Maricaulis sp. TaxID=174710 RepID=UPI002631206D|nr:cytochrome c oxidase subunit 3 [uncultured Maricaulis sp.]
MAGHAAKHDYHLVDPSPWPFVGSVGAFLLAIGAVGNMAGLVSAEHPLAFMYADGSWGGLALGFLIVIWTMIGWWGDMIKESKRGDHTAVVDIGMRYGMILFIASEVMFFVAWFWSFFEYAIFHEVRMDPALATWPPAGVETFNPWHIPLMNTLILLLSGTTVTWAHHALQHDDRKGAITGLIFTVALGMCFTALQVYEYSEAHFAFSMADGGNLYGSTFYMATGFHGAHVVIGTIFLAVCLFRLLAGQMSAKKHFGLEAAAWYWHFVDVVWLFLFAFVYVVYQG